MTKPHKDLFLVRLLNTQLRCSDESAHYALSIFPDIYVFQFLVVLVQNDTLSILGQINEATLQLCSQIDGRLN